MPGLPFTNLPAGQQYTPQEGPFAGINFKDFQQDNNPRPQQSQQPQQNGPPDPMSIVTNETHNSIRQLADYFDKMRYELDQENLKPQEYLAKIDALRQNVKQAEFTIHEKAQARVDNMTQLTKLMQEGLLPKEAGQRALWRVAGLDDETINAMLPQTKPVDWVQVHGKNLQEQNRVIDYLSRFSISGKNLYHVDDKGNVDKKNPATPGELQQYTMAYNLLDEFRKQEREVIYPNLTSLQQSALQMSRVTRTKMTGPSKFESVMSGIMPAMGPALAIKYKGNAPLFGPVAQRGKEAIEKLLWGPSKTKESEQPAEQPTGQPIYRKNPKTDETIVSYDGGKQWWKVQ